MMKITELPHQIHEYFTFSPILFFTSLLIHIFMKNPLATVISYLFHPLVMPLLAVLTVLYTGTYLSFLNPEAKRMIVLVVFLGTCLLPISLFPLYLYRRMISTIHFSVRSERILPLFISSLFYFFTFHMLRRIPVSGIILSITASSTLSLIILMIITVRFNISLHAAGIAGLVGFILALAVRMGIILQWQLLSAILLGGVIGFARLQLNAHKTAEVYIGYLVGFVVSFGFNYYYLRI